MKRIMAVVLALVALFSLASCGTAKGVKIIDIKLTEEEYAFVLKKGNTSLQNDFNAYLAKIKENGVFAEIVAKYFEGVGTQVGYDVTTANVANTEDNFVVATNCPFDPFEFIGSDGRVYGIDIEIAQGYAKEKGLTLVVKNIDFDTIFNEVDSGYSDMGMAGITITDSRLALYDFTTTYYGASQKLIVASDNTAFDNCKTAAEVEEVLLSLKNVKVGFQIGTTGNWYVAGDDDWGYDGFANIEATGYKTAQLAIQDIANGLIYGVVVDEAPAEAMVKAINK